MFKHLETATQGQVSGRLANLRRALSKHGKIPSYLDPMTPEGAAWSIVGAALCPSAYDKALAWVKTKDEFWRKMEEHGDQSIFHLLRHFLSDPNLAAAVDRAMIERLTGVGMVGFWSVDDDGREKVKTIRTASITDVKVDYENYAMKDVVMIEGRFLQEIAEELTAVAEAAEVQKN